MSKQSDRRPGDHYLTRYMPEATDAEREKARENLRAFAAVVLRVATRMASEQWKTDSSEAAERGRV